MKRLLHQEKIKEDNFIHKESGHTGEIDCLECNGNEQVNKKCRLAFYIENVDKKEIEKMFNEIKNHKKYMDDHFYSLSLKMLRNEIDKFKKSIFKFDRIILIVQHKITSSFNNKELLVFLLCELQEYSVETMKMEDEIDTWIKNNQHVVPFWKRSMFSIRVQLIFMLTGASIFMIIYLILFLYR